MNTRGFLKSLALVCVAPQILIPRAPDACRWVRVRAGMINPAWEIAEYEVAWLSSFEPYRPWIDKMLEQGVWIHRRNPGTDKVDYSIPAKRYVLNRETGLFEASEK